MTFTLRLLRRSAAYVFILCCCFPLAFAQLRVLTQAGGVVKDGGAATSGVLTSPRSAAYDKRGVLYIADFNAHRIRKVSTTGTISTLAGTGVSGYSGDGGSGKQAMISFPTGIAVDASGNVLFSDSGNSRIRKIDTTGVITTIAGTGTAGFGGDGGLATAATLNQPWGLWFDAAGNLYIADALNQRVRQVNTAGIINTIAGNGTAGYSGDGGPALQASLNLPVAVIVDSSNNLYIADYSNSRVRKVTTSGTISTFAGNGSAGCTGDGGAASAAAIGNPGGLAIQSSALVVATNGCSRIRSVVLSTGTISTAAGSIPGYDGDSHSPAASQFQSPRGVTIDKTGNLVVVDTGNNRVRKLTTTTQLVSTIAGGFIGDGGNGTSAALNAPSEFAFDSGETAYIADTLNNRIRKLLQSGAISTYAGTGVSGYSGDGGAATAAQLNSPLGVAVDISGNVFISDSSGTIIRKIDTSGTITTVAQLAVSLTNISVDPSDNVFGTDVSGCAIWKVTPTAVVSVVAGIAGSCGYNSDGILGTSAQLNAPGGVAVDSKGNLYIGDAGNNRVRMVTKTTGLISTIAGNGTCGFSGDGGAATAAMLCGPAGVANYKGTTYIADLSNRRIRSVSSTGTIQTVVGTGVAGYNGNDLLGTQTNADYAANVATNKIGAFYYSDTFEARVRILR